MTPLVLHPGNDAAPQIVLAVWIAEGATVLLVGDREGNEAITAPTVGDGIEAQLTGGALPNSQAASDSSGVELEPKVAAQILAALSRGDIQLAMELLAGIGAKGANLAPKFLEKIQGLHRIGDGQCEDIASRTAAVLRRAGGSPGRRRGLSAHCASTTATPSSSRRRAGTWARRCAPRACR
jgi:hypothetical protein